MPLADPAATVLDQTASPTTDVLPLLWAEDRTTSSAYRSVSAAPPLDWLGWFLRASQNTTQDNGMRLLSASCWRWRILITTTQRHATQPVRLLLGSTGCIQW